MEKSITTQSHDDHWLPLMEYSIKKNISLSTLRRYIKSDRVRYKIEHGRYLLWDEHPDQSSDSSPDTNSQLKRAQEEIAELKMLIALYEEKLPKQQLDI